MKSFYQRFNWRFDEETGLMIGRQYRSKKALDEFRVNVLYPVEDGKIEINIENTVYHMPTCHFICAVDEAEAQVKEYLNSLDDLEKAIAADRDKNDIWPRQRAMAQKIIDATFGQTRFYGIKTGDVVYANGSIEQAFGADRFAELVHKNFSPEDLNAEFLKGDIKK